MREAPLAENNGTLGFARELIAGDFDVVIFLAGVGIRALLKVVEITGGFEDSDSLSRLTWDLRIQK